MSPAPSAPLLLFAAPVYAATIADAALHAAGLRALIEQHRDPAPPATGSHRNMWRTTKQLHEVKDPHIAWLVARILEFSSRALSDQYDDWRALRPDIDACWANVGGLGAWLGPHNHFPRPWSGVYYVSVDHPRSEQERGGQLAFLNPNPIAQPRNVAYPPTDGLLFLFPGSLEHMAYPNLSPGERVSVAFNLAIVARK